MKFSLICFLALIAMMDAKAQEVIITSTQEPLDSTLNTRFFESHPVLSPSGETLLFTRSNHPQNQGGNADQGDVWIATLGPAGWQQAINGGNSINDNEQNAAIGFLDSQTLLLNGHYGKKDQGFSVAKKGSGQWGKPRNVTIPYFKSQSEFQSASLSPDGSVIIFSLASFGTFGVEDLYFSRLQSDGSWSDLRNLGPVINTRYQEMTPFISPDNKTLYFASNGHRGEGSLDIFRSQRLDDTWRNWSPPVNLGPLVNTEGSESSFSFLPGSDWALLVSTQNSDGYGDLKKVGIAFPEDQVLEKDSLLADHPLLEEVSPDTLVVVPEPTTTVTPSVAGKIFNRKSGKPIPGQLVFLAGEEVIVTSDSTQGFRAVLTPGEYQLRVKSKDYLEYDTTMVVADQSGIRQDFYLFPLEIGSTITLNHVLFQRGTTDLMPDADRDLEAVYRMLVENPAMEILVAGHTDNQGNFKLNVKLSQDRVDRVVEYLINKGVKKNRISGKGWGPMKPIASNATEETRRLNRRVEFTILKK